MQTYVMIKQPDGSNTELRVYNDLDQATVEPLLIAEGVSYIVVTNRDFITTLGTLVKVIDINSVLRDKAVSAFQVGTNETNKIERAILLSVIDAFNVLRQRDTDRSQDVALATSLADLKVRWAARSSFSDITVQQAKNAVLAKINSGDAD
jgi:hypothetical protein